MSDKLRPGDPDGTFFDSDGNAHCLVGMCRAEPEWAASRLRVEIRKWEALKVEIEQLRGDDFSAYVALLQGCPDCIAGKHERAMIDENGVLCSVSGETGRWGHSLGDVHWYCTDAGAIAQNDRLRGVLRAAFDQVTEAPGWCVDWWAEWAGVAGEILVEVDRQKPPDVQCVACSAVDSVGGESCDGSRERCDNCGHEGHARVCGCKVADE